MKKTICLLILLLTLALALASCGFVQYRSYADEEDDSQATAESLEQMIQSLRAWQLSDPDDEELDLYDRMLLEAENELHEADSDHERLALFEKHSTLLKALSIELLGERMQSAIDAKTYRAADQLLVDALRNTYLSQLRQMEDGTEGEVLLRLFKTELAEIKTADQHYAEELAARKKELLENGVQPNYALYRAAQREQITALAKAFERDLADLATKEQVEALYESYQQSLAVLPTAEELLEREQAAYLAAHTPTLTAFAEAHGIDAVELNEVLAEIGESTSEQQANRLAALFMISYLDSAGEEQALREAIAVAIANGYVPGDYRPVQQQTLSEIEAQALTALESAEDAEGMRAILQSTLTSFAEVPTNDALWEKSLADFNERLTALYGTYVLQAPEDLTKADSYRELGQIIDYFAFYQLYNRETSTTSFLQDTFRVELNFPHRYAEWELVEMHWYCELIRTGVGLCGYFEGDSSQMVFTLLPYEIATQNSGQGPVTLNRYDTYLTLDTGATLLPRSADFKDFPYLSQYTRSVAGVWNSQQLWYALEHEYIPLVVEGSAAETVLRRAEQILREIICDGMSIEQKVLAIYTWFARNVTYDYGYTAFLKHDDRELRPDRYVSALRCLHADGPLLDGVGICCGYAKANLILLRMEGIEAYRLTLHYEELHSICDGGGGEYGSHALVALRASDGKFYYNDAEQSFTKSNSLQDYAQILVPKAYQSAFHNGVNKIYDTLDFATEMPMHFWQNLSVFGGLSVLPQTEEELDALLDAFAAETRSDKVLHLFAIPGVGNLGITSQIRRDGRFEVFVQEFRGFHQYYVYPAGVTP